MRQGDWKLIYWHPDQRFELFNLANDIGEEHNLATAEPKRVKTMAATMTKLLKERTAQMPSFKAGNSKGMPAGTPFRGRTNPPVSNSNKHGSSRLPSPSPNHRGGAFSYGMPSNQRSQRLLIGTELLVEAEPGCRRARRGKKQHATTVFAEQSGKYRFKYR